MATAVCETCTELVEKCKTLTYDNTNFRVTDNKLELVSDSGVVVASILGGQLCTMLAAAGCSLGGSGGVPQTPLQIANGIAGDQDAQDVLATALGNEIAAALLGNATWRDSLSIAIEPKICDLMSQDPTCMSKMLNALKPLLTDSFCNDPGWRNGIANCLADALSSDPAIKVKWQNILSTGQGVKGPVTVLNGSGLLGDGFTTPLFVDGTALYANTSSALEAAVDSFKTTRVVVGQNAVGNFPSTLAIAPLGSPVQYTVLASPGGCAFRDAFGNPFVQSDFSYNGAKIFMLQVDKVVCP